MATAFATPKQITYCPPRPAHGSASPEPVFGAGWDRHKAVDSQFGGVDEWDSPGIAYEDYTRMRCVNHKPSGERRYPTPAWALNDNDLRQVLVLYYERRAGLRKHRRASLSTRLRKADAKLKASIPDKMRTLEKMGREYIALKSAN